MKNPSTAIILLLAAACPPLAHAQDRIVSVNFHKGSDPRVTGSYGSELLGVVAANWNNYDNTGGGSNLLDDDGIASSVDFTSSGFFQFTGLYPSNLDYSNAARYGNTALRAGPPTTSAGNPLVVNLADLNATFPGGFKVAVFLTGRPDNAGASISDGTSTYYFRQPAPLVENVLVNGDFESGTGTTYALSPPWFNAGTSDQTQVLRTTAQINNGAYSGQLVEAAGRLPNQKTGYEISTGDTFVVRFAWREGFNWHASDQVKVRLFCTSDDTLGGTPIEIQNFTDSKTINATWKNFSSLPVTVPAGAVGRTLFVQLDTIDGNGNANGFGFIDDVVVSVYPAPSPNQKLTTDTNNGDGIDTANLAVFGSDAAPLNSDSLSLTMTALSEGVASIGGIQIISANPATARTSLISCNLYGAPASVDVIEPNSTWGLGAEGSPAGSTNWNNIRYTIDEGPSGIPLRFSNGVPSTVTVLPTDGDNDGKWDATWGFESSFSAVWNNTAMRAGRATYSSATPVQYDLNNLNANFPFGYRLIVYLSGFEGNDLASISDGATTYFFQVGTATLPPRQGTETTDPGVGSAQDAEYVVFGSAGAPLHNDSLSLTLAHIAGGGVAIAGFQIVGHELDVDIQSLVGNSLHLSVGNVPPGLTLQVLDSTDLNGFSPLSPPILFDSSTSQPLVVPVDTVAQPKRFFSIAPAPVWVE